MTNEFDSVMLMIMMVQLLESSRSHLFIPMTRKLGLKVSGEVVRNRKVSCSSPTTIFYEGLISCPGGRPGDGKFWPACFIKTFLLPQQVQG